MTREEQRYIREANKQLDLSIKTTTKQCGFQKVNGYVYKLLNNFVYVCLISISPVHLGKKISVRLSFKPVVLDEIFWDIFEITDGKKQPKSFHVQGAFTAPTADIEKWEVDIESIEVIDLEYQKLLIHTAFLIETHSNKYKDVAMFRDYILAQEYQKLNCVLSEIYLKNYQSALNILKDEISRGKIGGFADAEGKSIYEYAKAYVLKIADETS